MMKLEIRITECVSFLWKRAASMRSEAEPRESVCLVSSLGFWFPRCRVQIPGTGFLSLQLEFGLWIPIFNGILDSLSRIPDSKAQDAVVNRQKFTGFWNSDSFTCGELVSVLNNRQDKISEPVYAKGRQEEGDGKTFVRDKCDSAILAVLAVFCHDLNIFFFPFFFYKKICLKESQVSLKVRLNTIIVTLVTQLQSFFLS